MAEDHFQIKTIKKRIPSLGEQYENQFMEFSPSPNSFWGPDLREWEEKFRSQQEVSLAEWSALPLGDW